ncbi:MAG TPA: DUF1349 domain-containing protein, partial [Planctomycetota bacterium]|nr:DUF1349 domain-containing protein [Planctomycetota bacterium]
MKSVCCPSFRLLALALGLLVSAPLGASPQAAPLQRASAIPARTVQAPASDSVYGWSLVAGLFQSDDFDHCGGLSDFWTLVDPTGDSTVAVQGVGTGQAVLNMTAAAGSEHQAWNSIYAPHLIQPLGSGDFEVELQFTDRPDNDEIYGLIVKQDEANWLRFDFYGYGGSTYAYCGRTYNGRTSNRSNQVLSGGSTPLWMRVGRSGNSFRFESSTDGVSWTLQRSFNQNIYPDEIGPYVGNFGSFPAASMGVDYFFDTIAPISPEDAGTVDLPLTLTLGGSGAVDLNPPGGLYACGTSVTLTATPAPGWRFVRWSGDLAGTNPVAQVTMDGAHSVTADFEVVGGNPAPVISGVQIQPLAGGASVQWDTDLSANSQVDYGLTEWLGSTVFNANFVTQHALQLTQLMPGATYYLQITSITPLGALSQAGNWVLVTAPAVPVLTSEDFNTCGGPSPLWTVEDPGQVANFTTLGMGTSDAFLQVEAPGGALVEAFGTLSVPYLWQPMGDGDFDVTTRIQTLPDADRSAGALVVEDADNWLSFELYHAAGMVRATGVVTQAGSSVRVFDAPVAGFGSAWLRLVRTGNDFEFRYSDNGATYQLLNTSNVPLDANRFGLYGGNLGTLPGVSAQFDFVEDALDPLSPEDGPIGGVAPRVLTFNATPSGGSIVADPGLAAYACDEVVSLLAVPDPGFAFSNWTGDLSGNANPASLTMDVDHTFGAVFVPINVPPVITNVQVAPGTDDALVTWTTDVPATSRVEFGTTLAFGSMVESANLVTSHQLLLPGLMPTTQYQFQVSSVGAGGQTIAPSDVFTTQTPANAVVTSDDFNGCGGLGAQWAFVDSQFFDGQYGVQGAGTGDAQLWISVPAGVERENYNTLHAPRVMQAVEDTDFEVELKFESELTTPYQIQGLLVQQDATNWLRFDLYRAPGGVRFYAGSTVSGVTQTKADGALTLSAPYYLRVGRAGNLWTYSVSGDGANWQQVASFTRAAAILELGPYAGNSFYAGNSPAFTAVCDYVFDVADPIVPEDGPRGNSGPFVLGVTVPQG